MPTEKEKNIELLKFDYDLLSRRINCPQDGLSPQMISEFKDIRISMQCIESVLIKMLET